MQDAMQLCEKLCRVGHLLKFIWPAPLNPGKLLAAVKRTRTTNGSRLLKEQRSAPPLRQNSSELWEPTQLRLLARS